MASGQEADGHYRDPAAGSDASPKHTRLDARGPSFDCATRQSNLITGNAGDIVCTEFDGLATDLEVGLQVRRARELG